MTAPNIRANTGTIEGKVVGKLVTSTPQNLILNASGSNKLLKVNTIIVSNVDGSASDEVIITLVKAYGSGSPITYHLAKNIVIPAKASLDVLAGSVYLEEDDKIMVAGVAASGDLEAVASYEDIS
jgi:hypothetical protein